MAYTLDAEVGHPLKDTQAVDILGKHFAGISKNPMIGLAQGMSIRSLLQVPQAREYGVTEDKVQQVLADINCKK
jgi:hypothetical protein